MRMSKSNKINTSISSVTAYIFLSSDSLFYVYNRKIDIRSKLRIIGVSSSYRREIYVSSADTTTIVDIANEKLSKFRRTILTKIA